MFTANGDERLEDNERNFDRVNNTENNKQRIGDYYFSKEGYRNLVCLKR